MRIQHESSESFQLKRDTNVRGGSMACLQTHGHYEFYYLLEGKRNYFLNNAIYPLEPGDAVLIPPHVLHRTIGNDTEPYSRILLSIPAIMPENTLAEALGTAPRIIRIPRNRRAMLEALIDKLELEHSTADAYSAYLLRSHVNELLIFLLRASRSGGFSRATPKNSRLISSAARYISENFAAPLSLETVAAQVGLSKNHFCRLFREETGFHFSDYLTGVRINEAARLLLDTDLSVTEIASRCGYNDSAYFAMIFKRIKGTTPVKYRKSSGI